MQRSKKLRPARRDVLLGLLAATAGLACIVFSSLSADYLQLTRLADAAQGLVDDALTQNTQTFLAVSALKAGLALVEGSSVGVGIEVQVGDLVQPVYDYVDYIWRFLFYSLLILGFYKLLLDTGVFLIGMKVVGLGLLLAAAASAWPHRRKRLARIARSVALGGLLFAYVVPLALIATNWAASTYTDPLKDRYAGSIERVRIEARNIQAEFLALKDELSITSPNESLSLLRTRLRALVVGMTRTIEDALHAFIYYVVIVLCELFVFPLISAYALYKGAHFAFGRFFETHRMPHAAQAQHDAP